MRIACKVLIGLALLHGAALFAAEGPEIQVENGKISMSARAVPLGRLLTLFGRAVGLDSEVNPELANRNISVQFTDLEMNDAVRKIFEGQPLNYVLIEGKSIHVTDLAQGQTAAPVASAPAFPDSQPVFTSPVQSLAPAGVPNQAQPRAQPPQQNANGQPANPNTPFGPQQTLAPNALAPASNSPTVSPGQIPPPIGGTNPLVSPAGGNPAGTGFPGATTLPTTPQPTGPGTLGGATPGVLGR